MYMHVKSIHNTVIIYKYLSYNMISANKIKKKNNSYLFIKYTEGFTTDQQIGRLEKKSIIKKKSIWGRIFKN